MCNHYDLLIVSLRFLYDLLIKRRGLDAETERLFTD